MKHADTSSRASTDDAFDVVIVGYGPTGMALSYWLGAAGHRVAVVERWTGLYPLPRAGHVDGEIMRLFQRMGVAEEIARDSSVTTFTRIRGADGTLIIDLPAEASDQGWDSHYSLYQPNLERTLDTAVRRTGAVTVLQGWQADHIERTGADEVVLTLSAGADDRGVWTPIGSRRTISARWLVGADGANSIVAATFGDQQQDFGHKARALVIFADRHGGTAGSTMPDSEVGMIPSRPYVAFRESGKRYARWEFHVHDDERTEVMNQAATAWELIQPWGFTADNSRLVRHTVFEFRTLVSPRWRDGNVIIAGDSAHRMPPFQGQGMCSGQRDAAALAWRLDLVLRGVADDDILDSYTRERRPQVVELTVNAAARGTQFWLTDADAARSRDETMRADLAAGAVGGGYGGVPCLTDGIFVQEDGHPLRPAGELSPQFRVLHGGQEVLLDDVVRGRWLLVGHLSGPPQLIDHPDRRIVHSLDAIVWDLDDRDPDHGLRDHRGEYARWLEEHGCRAVLIRPDSYIFGGVTGPATAADLVASLCDQVHMKTVVA